MAETLIYSQWSKWLYPKNSNTLTHNYLSALHICMCIYTHIHIPPKIPACALENLYMFTVTQFKAAQNQEIT